MNVIAVSFTSVDPTRPYAFDAEGNGSVAISDMTATVDFIDVTNKLVVTGNNDVDIARSLQYAILMRQTNLNDNAPVAVTADVYEAVYDRLVTIVALNQICLVRRAMLGANCPMLMVRGSDVLNVEGFRRINDNRVAGAASFAGDWFSQAAGDEVFLAQVATRIRFLIILALANAMIRKASAGHNFLTAEIDQAGSATNRACSAAGGDVLAFKSWARATSNGHDSLHFLSDGALTVLIEFFLSTTPHSYGGRNVSPKDYFAVPPSVSDRWPLGMPGTAMLHLGIGMIEAMLTTTSMKSTIVGENGDPVNYMHVITLMRAKLSTVEAGNSRAALVAYKGSLVPLVAFAVGFASCTQVGRDNVENYKSISGLSATYPGDYTRGKNVGSFVEGQAFDADSVSRAIGTFVTLMQNIVQEEAD